MEKTAKEIAMSIISDELAACSETEMERLAVAIRDAIKEERMARFIIVAIRDAIKEERMACLRVIGDLIAKCDGDETGIGSLMLAERIIKERV